jgi:hypothetical protein
MDAVLGSQQATGVLLSRLKIKAVGKTTPMWYGAPLKREQDGWRTEHGPVKWR